MGNAIQSVLGMFKSLLPLGPGSTLPVEPKLPDFSAFLDNMMAVLQGILGSSPDPAASQAPPPPPVSLPTSTPSLPTTIPQAPKPSSIAMLKSGSGSSSSSDPKSADPAGGAPPRPADVSPPALTSAAISAQIEQIRGIVERIQKGTSSDGSTQATAPRQAITDLAQALVELKKQILAAGQGPAQASSLPAAAAAPGGAPGSPIVPAVPVPAPPGPGVAGLSVLALAPKSGGQDALSLPPSQIPAPVPSLLAAAPKEGAGTFDAALDAAASALRTSGEDAVAAVPPAAGVSLATVVASETVIASESSSEPRKDLPLPGAAAGRGASDRPSLPTSQSGAAEAPTPEERAEFVGELVKAVRLTQSRGNARIKLDLNPPNLGTLKMDLSVRQHVLHGTFQADNAAAKELLLSHLPSLRQSLEDQGIQVGNFQVQVDQSFQQASQKGSEGTPSRRESLEAKGGSEDPSLQAQDRIRSARLQMIDYVA